MKLANKRQKAGRQLNTVFIGGLPLDTHRAELLEYLRAFDQVLNLDIAMDNKTKQLKGFAKAELRSSQGVDRLLAVPQHALRGLVIGIKRWTNKSEYLKGKDQISKRKLYVRHHPSYTKDDLAFHFSIFGKVVSVDEKIDHFSGKPRNFAYITFESEIEAHRAAQYGIVSEKSEFIYCELTTPSYLMSSESKASPCVSPTFRVPTKSTKRGTVLSFERAEDTYFQYESLNLDIADEKNYLRNARFPSRECRLVLDQQTRNLGSHQVLVNPGNREERLRNVRTCHALDQTNKFQMKHSTKPTSKSYSRRVDTNHSKENLVFLGPARDRPLARLVLR